MAKLDRDYTLAAGVLEDNDKYQLDTSNLERYFVPLPGKPMARELLTRTQHGGTYKEMANEYLFRRAS